MRIGIGHDAHKLKEGKKLILGGVDIPYEKGEISVHAYKNGKLCGTSSLHTVGKAAAVKVVFLVSASSIICCSL